MDNILLILLGMALGFVMLVSVARNPSAGGHIEKWIRAWRGLNNPSPVKPLELESAKEPALPQNPINPPVQQPDLAVLLERIEALVKENEVLNQSLQSKDETLKAKDIQLAAKDQEIARLNARILELDPPKRQLFRRVDQ